MPLVSLIMVVLTTAISLWPTAAIAPRARIAMASPVPRGDPAVGIHINPDVPDRPAVGVFGVERLWDTGAIWCRMNPAPGVWDFSPLQNQLTQARRRGASSAIIVLGFPPAHAVQGAPNIAEAPWLCPQPGSASLLPSDAVWDEYVQRTVNEVSAWQVAHPGLAVHFQVWNEPAVLWFLATDQAPARLVELAQRARGILKAALPEALLLSPPVVANRTVRKATWQAAFVAAAGVGLFDVWTVHMYPKGASFDEVWSGRSGYVSEMADVLATIAPARQPGDQVWVTEINANIAFDAAPSQVLSDEDQRRFVQAVTADRGARGIAVVVWYRWHYNPWAVGHGQIVLSGQSAAMSAVRGG